MKQYEKKVYSQQGEDGIIEHIFDVIGTTNKTAVEIGVSANGYTQPRGSECNTYYLTTQGWKTYWFDIMDIDIEPSNCTFTKVALTPENVNQIFEQLKISTEMDLLSIDIDGNDYHLRESLSTYRPRVCVQEYNGAYDAYTEYVMPRNDSYVCQGDTNFGASLLSMTKQAQQHGYDLVYCDQRGVNAFFVRKDINPFPAKTPVEAWVKLFWAK